MALSVTVPTTVKRLYILSFLGDLCGTSAQPKATAQAALKQWSAAGFPANQLLLGLALYGCSLLLLYPFALLMGVDVSNSKKTVLTGSFVPDENVSAYIQKPEVDEDGKVTFVKGAHPRTKGTMHTMADLRAYYGQQVAFNIILSSGALVQNADGNYGEAGGFTYAWDNCSDTPVCFFDCRVVSRLMLFSTCIARTSRQWSPSTTLIHLHLRLNGPRKMAWPVSRNLCLNKPHHSHLYPHRSFYLVPRSGLSFLHGLHFFRTHLLRLG